MLWDRLQGWDPGGRRGEAKGRRGAWEGAGEVGRRRVVLLGHRRAGGVRALVLWVVTRGEVESEGERVRGGCVRAGRMHVSVQRLRAVPGAGLGGYGALQGEGVGGEGEREGCVGSRRPARVRGCCGACPFACSTL